MVDIVPKIKKKKVSLLSNLCKEQLLLFKSNSPKEIQYKPKNLDVFI